MRSAFVLAMVFGFAVAPVPASASERPSSFDFEFTFPPNPESAPDVSILDETVQWFVLAVVGDPTPIDYLEFEISGLTHDSPQDLNLILLGPNGFGIELMDDAGDGFALSDMDILFADKGIGLPHGVGEGAIQPWPETIYQPDGPGSFSQFTMTGPGAWYLVVIDDAAGDAGSFDSVTLRGTVPEPMTLSLLALGAMAAIRRRRN